MLQNPFFCRTPPLPSMKGVPIQDTFCGRLMPLSFPTATRFLDKAPLYQRGAARGSGDFIQSDRLRMTLIKSPRLRRTLSRREGAPLTRTFRERLMPLSFPTATRFLDKAPLYQRGAARGSGDLIQADRPSASAKPPPGVAHSAGGEKTFTIPSSPFVLLVRPHNKRTKEEAYCQSQNRMK